MKKQNIPTNRLRERFSELLRHQRKVSKIPQCKIAEKLGISASAVCQIMRGYTMPRLAHFNQLCEILSIPREVATELRSMRNQIRAGDSEMPSRFNRTLRSFREQRGLSLVQLSKLLEINLNDLKIFEECPEAIPTVSECQRLAEILECDQADLMFAAGLGIGPQLEYAAGGTYSSTAESPAKVAEAAAEYRPEVSFEENREGWHPVLPLGLMPHDKNVNALEFAERRAISFKYDPNLPEGAIIIRGATREIGMRDKGSFEIAIVKAPLKSHQFVLAHKKSGWTLGVMQPYRNINRLNGTIEPAPADRMMWLIIQLSINMDI